MLIDSNQPILLYRMALDQHICPYDIAAKELLIEHHIHFTEIVMVTRQEVDAFKAIHHVKTTP